jgi:3',5'-cyclic AMP phosphodiesterase CpdA
MKFSRRTILAILIGLCSLSALNAQEAKPDATKPEATKAPEKSGARKVREWGTAPLPEFTPERVMLGWVGDPAHTQAITWRTEKLAETPQIEFTIASANPDFIKSATSVSAKSGSLGIGNGKVVATYRANLEGLKPNTHYLYRAGDGTNWGEWNGFHTANDQPTKFRFIYVGDAQNDIRSRWSRLIQAAYTKAPKSAFIINAGDLVSEGYKDNLWGEWYDSMGFIAANVPSLAVPGNHELEKPAGTPKGESLPLIWKQQFSYPQNGPDIPENESYYFDYQGVRFISLNVNMMENEKNFEAVKPMIEKEAAWLEGALKDNPNHWTVVFQHQGMFSMAHDRNYVNMREALLLLYDKYGVDLVLQGHDHLYARSQKLAGGKIVAPDAPGTVYMISVSGPKMYEIDHRFEPLMAKVIPNTQMFQVIDVDGDQMRLRAYSSEGDLLDGFQLMKKNGHSVYSELDKAATGATVGK